MNLLTGSQPQAKFSTQPTGTPGQIGLLPDINSILQNTIGYAAPQIGQVSGEAVGALPGQLTYQAPQIDATTAFQQGVVQPVTQDFLQRTLPSIAGQFGGSAGGAFGSGSAQARNQAGIDTTRALAQAGSQYSLGAAAANQQAANQAAQIRNAALGLAPGTAGITSAAMQPTIQDLLTLALSPTQQTLGVGTGGSTGLIQGLLSGGLAQGAGSAGGLAIASALGLI